MRLTVLALAALALTAVPASAQQASLYQRLGGYPAIKAVVDDFVGNVEADKRINRFFARTDIARLKQNLVDQICSGTGGPCFYTGRDMKSAHAGMGVRAATSTRWCRTCRRRCASSRCRSGSRASCSRSSGR